jgi:hypothetical protein
MSITCKAPSALTPVARWNVKHARPDLSRIPRIAVASWIYKLQDMGFTFKFRNTVPRVRKVRRSQEVEIDIAKPLLERRAEWVLA